MQFVPPEIVGPETSKTVTLNLTEAFGMRISNKAGLVLVHSLTVGGQAERAGFKIGSRVVSINGESVHFLLCVCWPKTVSFELTQKSCSVV